MVSSVIYFLPLVLLAPSAESISNYDKQGISQNYTEGLPEFATVNGLESNLGDIPSGIRLNKTQIYLDCSSDFMNITLTFREKFYGIVYADYNSQNNDYDRTCRINGDGHIKRELILSLKGCGTVQSPARVFINNIVVRFHPGLEMDGDEVITVICRYPEPIIINPPAIPAPLVVAPGTPIQALQPLRDFEVLLIICAIIFLALLLLGFGCSYYCLKKRNIKVVRKRPASTLGSEITKASDPISMFSGLKIPRAHAVESSGSEQLTESIHTEYNSEETSGASEEEYHSTYSDQACEISEGVIFSQVKDPSLPEFDVKAIIKQSQRPRSPESSRMSSDSEVVLKAQEQFLTTILERTETNTKETLERVRRLEAKKGPPPVHARIRVHNKQLSDQSEIESESEFSQVPSEYYEDDICIESRDTTNALLEQRNEFDVNIKTRPKEIHYTTDEDSSVMFSDNESIQPIRPPIGGTFTKYTNREGMNPLRPDYEPPNATIHPGGITTTKQTITNYTNREGMKPQRPDYEPPNSTIHPGGITTTKQSTTNYTNREGMNPQRPDYEPPNPTVQSGGIMTTKQTITNYTNSGIVKPLRPDYDLAGRPPMDLSVRPKQPPGQTTTVKYTDHPSRYPNTRTNYTVNEQTTTATTIVGRQHDEMSQITTSGVSISDVHGRDRFDVFIRVLDPPDYSDTHDEISSVFTEDERIRIKEVILQDVKVQKMIETATSTSDFIHIKNQKSLRSVVEPQKWDVLIRILQNPINFEDTIERASSRSTKTGASNQELRSLSEVMVDLDRRSIPARSDINTPTLVYEDMSQPPQGGMDVTGRREEFPGGGEAHYVVADSSRPGMTTTEVHHHYYSSSPSGRTITREGGFNVPERSFHQMPIGAMSNNPGMNPDILAPIIHQVDEETGSTIRRVIQSVSQQEGFDIRYGFPDEVNPKDKTSPK